MLRQVAAHAPGTRLAATVIREGEAVEMMVTVGERPSISGQR
jgi:S1-C subfamily serine protease